MATGCTGAPEPVAGPGEPPPRAASSDAEEAQPELRSVDDRRPIVWIDDDVPAARKLALAEDKLLFVDVWAPWCHTCLAMKTGALLDPALRRFQSKFVFVALDSDKPENSDFIDSFVVPAWPTFFVIDPVSDRAVGLIAGGASAQELEALMDGASKPAAPESGSSLLQQAASSFRIGRLHGSGRPIRTRHEGRIGERKENRKLGAAGAGDPRLGAVAATELAEPRNVRMLVENGWRASMERRHQPM